MISLYTGTVPEWNPDYRQFVPSLTEFLIEGENLPALIIYPGGGYAKVCWDPEGYLIACWANSVGMNAFVVDYRIAPYDGKAFLADGFAAIDCVRNNAERFHIDPHKVGVAGFSAGGHLAASMMTFYDSPAHRPDFGILCYGVLTLSLPSATHLGTRRAFLGKEHGEDEEYAARYSPVLHVTKETPPAFLWTTSTDAAVPPIPSTVAMHEAMDACGVKNRCVVYDHGAHGLGMAFDDPEISQWPVAAAEFLTEIGIIGKAAQ